MYRDFSPDLELSELCARLWAADVNRLEPGKDYSINLQGGEDTHTHTHTHTRFRIYGASVQWNLYVMTL